MQVHILLLSVWGLSYDKMSVVLAVRGPLAPNPPALASAADRAPPGGRPDILMTMCN
jgi:hypothetical protein